MGLNDVQLETILILKSLKTFVLLSRIAYLEIIADLGGDVPLDLDVFSVKDVASDCFVILDQNANLESFANSHRGVDLITNANLISSVISVLVAG